MNQKLAEQLRTWAKHYNNSELFLQNDPIQVPNRYRNGRIQDLEISAFLTAYLSFGNRKQIVKTALRLDEIMCHSPYCYVRSRQWQKNFSETDQSSFYRTISHKDMYTLFSRLYDVYTLCETMENAILSSSKAKPAESHRPFHNLCHLFGVSDKSPQKKLNMFLRWMIRTDGIVDFGAWHAFSPKDLIIPLDTHVAQMACKLGLVASKNYSLRTALSITAALAEVFPNDPCLGDFALFGYGVEND